jgi:cell division septation protein DedD
MNLTPPAASTPVAPAPAVVTSSTAAAGTYAVQLVGTTSSDEAKAALERVNTRFRSDLGSYRPTIVKAEDGGRTVYRVRVINLSSDDANKLCAKLKASGGTCFVARS